MYQLPHNKTYTLLDFIKIPFLICPLYTSVKIANQILNAFIPSIQLLITANFIDTALDIFNDKLHRSAIYTPLILLMLIVAYTYLNWQLMSFINLKTEIRMTKIYRSEVADKRAKLEYKHIESNETWDLISRTCANPVGRIQGGFDNIMSATNIVIRVLSLLLILITQVWWAGIAIVLIAIPLFALAIKGGKETYKANKEAEKHTRRANYLQGVLQGRDNVEERTLFGYTEDINAKWYDKFETSRKINLKVQSKYFIKLKGSSLITVLLSILITVVLLFPLKNGDITIGMFMSLVTTTLGLVQMMSWQLSYTMSELAKNREYLKDLTSFFSLSETKGALDLPEDSNQFIFEYIEFINVSFKYPGTEKYVLKNFNLRLENMLHYAFVGVNGAGKTTITKLLTGMYDDYEGEILMNGRSLRTYTHSELKSIFAVVYQDFAKYQISLYDNIALGNVLSDDMEKVKEAASLIDLNSVIEKLPNGINTSLGKIKENGTDISGGEWQRVAIARALNNPAKIRILDEPTAALDPVAESNIYEMFGRISTGKSTIFITHRLGAARLADIIVVIDDGKVIEMGSHDKLLNHKGVYAEMFEAQRSWYQ